MHDSLEIALSMANLDRSLSATHREARIIETGFVYCVGRFIREIVSIKEEIEFRGHDWLLRDRN